jgi:hypothetical protein
VTEQYWKCNHAQYNLITVGQLTYPTYSIYFSWSETNKTNDIIYLRKFLLFILFKFLSPQNNTTKGHHYANSVTSIPEKKGWYIIEKREVKAAVQTSLQ